MRPYEVMVIFDASTEPPLIQAVVDGRSRRFVPTAATRERSSAGVAAVRLRGEPQARGLLPAHRVHGRAADGRRARAVLSLADEVMRHKIIRLPDKVAGTRRASAPAKSGSSRPAASKPTATAPVEPAPSRPPADRSRHG